MPRPQGMSKQDWRARRERVRRRKVGADILSDPLKFSGEVLELNMHGKSYKVHEFKGKLANCYRAGKPYERKLLEHIRAQKFTGTAVDAGAHVGNHSLWFAVMCGLQVIAFEPARHADLTRNVELNNLQGVIRVEPFALGDAVESRRYAGRGKLRHDGKGPSFPVVPLDSYGLENISLIKIDVEGMEPYVLRGAEHTIRRCRPIIFAEEWGKPEHNAIARVLEPWGYRMVKQFSGKESATPVGRWDPS